jgi:hypothetical protein
MKAKNKTTVVLGMTAAAAAALIAALPFTSTAHASAHIPVAVQAASNYHSPVVPKALKVPPGNKQSAVLSGRGVQVYQCDKGAWTLLEPAATMTDPRHGGRTVALHSRGPVWVSTVDGSAVTASAVATVERKGAVPELLLKANDHRGTGMFGRVSYVQRLETKGGLAPSGSCAAGAQRAVPYQATYAFYTPAK